jgi:hypothetical protein
MKKQKNAKKAQPITLITKAPANSVIAADLQNGGGPTDFVQSHRESKKK